MASLTRRIGIDGTCWLNRRGYGRFARRLVTELVQLHDAAAYSLVVDFDPAEAPALPAGVRVLRVASARPAADAASADGRRSLRDLWLMSRALSRERFDLVFFPAAYTYVPITGPSRVVVTMHDTIAEQFPRQAFPTLRNALAWRCKVLAARWQADAIVTVSETSQRAIMQRFRIPAKRIEVVREAAADAFRPLPHDAAFDATLARWGLTDQRFMLYVGGMNPHKNLGTLLDAFAALRSRQAGAGYRLVLAGDIHGDVFYSAHDALQQQIAALELADTVVFTGYVPDAQLAHLYNGAAACILPSRWEGFGLPAIEAMASGTPVVASARGALPEVVASAGMLFDPDRPGDLAATLERLLSDDEMRARYRRLGPARAAEFSWERAAHQTLALFRRVLACRP